MDLHESSTALIVVIDAKKSPIAELGDLGEVRALLRDPDTVWEI